ncbi:hypothetical protein QL285_031716 [Trifolium repens]|nr:hypothetical protein QL285_031716 [Trifolium repens]
MSITTEQICPHQAQIAAVTSSPETHRKISIPAPEQYSSVGAARKLHLENYTAGEHENHPKNNIQICRKPHHQSPENWITRWCGGPTATHHTTTYEVTF